jgi:acyl carrier protein
MTTPAPADTPAAPAAPAACGPVTADCPLFDCLQVNLAVLADRWHGPGTHLDLGAVLHFDPVPGPGGLPTVQRPTPRHLADTARALHLSVTEQHTTAGRPPEPAPGRYVVADAHHLPWVPYFRRRHMDHSFLLEPGDGDTAVVTDGYHNDTPWGAARPTSLPLSRTEVAAALPQPALVLTLAPAGPPRTPPAPRLDLATPQRNQQYARAYAEHPDRLTALDQLTLETWLLARSRRLHARFLASRGLLTDSQAVTAHLTAWQSLAESAYVAHRRVQRGHPEPHELYERLARQLHHDHDIFTPTATHTPARLSGGPPGAPDAPACSATAPTPLPTPPSAALRTHIAATAGAVLRTDPAPLLDGLPLADIPGFTSLRMVEIVERLERELSVEFTADDLVPENLHHLDGICRIVLRALPAPTAPSHVTAQPPAPEKTDARTRRPAAPPARPGRRPLA